MSRQQPIVLWPAGAPGARGAADEDIPTLTPFVPSSGTGAAIIVCPGGGYGHLAPHEADPIAEWLNSVGVTAFVLKYRLAPRYAHPAPVQDAARALRTARARAAEWDLDPGRIGILGFSAGGHLASTAGTHYDAGAPDAPDAVERAASRPDLLVLVYPVISFGEQGHAGSRANLIGDPPPPDLVELLSNEKQVTADTPPAFLIHTVEDAGVPCENSVLFAQALRKAGVPFELHLFERGPHGFGLGLSDAALSRWPDLCAAWLRGHAFARQ